MPVTIDESPSPAPKLVTLDQCPHCGVRDSQAVSEWNAGVVDFFVCFLMSWQQASALQPYARHGSLVMVGNLAAQGDVLVDSQRLSPAVAGDKLQFGVAHAAFGQPGNRLMAGVAVTPAAVAYCLTICWTRRGEFASVTDSGQLKPPLVAVIDLDEFDAAVERIRRLRPDVPGGSAFQP